MVKILIFFMFFCCVLNEEECTIHSHSKKYCEKISVTKNDLLREYGSYINRLESNYSCCYIYGKFENGTYIRNCHIFYNNDVNDDNLDYTILMISLGEYDFWKGQKMDVEKLECLSKYINISYFFILVLLLIQY